MIYVNGRFLTQKLTGVQRFAFEMVKSLLEYEIDLMILVPPKKIDASFGSINTWPLEIIGKNGGTIWEQVDLPLYLNSNNKPLLVNLVNTAPAFYYNQVVSVLDMTTFINPKWFNFKFTYWYKLLVPIIVKKALKVITISQSSKNDIVRILKTDPDKIDVLYCGVAEQFMNPAFSHSSTELLKKLSLTNGNYILAVSSLDPRKNFRRLIEAYLELKVSIPLVIVGSQGKVFADDGIKKLISEKDNVKFTGYVNDRDLINLYSNAMVFVYPSLYEGFGMPPLEAMACNCPTIVSNTSSLPEVCGDASVYVDPYEIESIKMGMIDVITNEELRLRLMAFGKEQIKKFSWQRSALQLREIIALLN